MYLQEPLYTPPQHIQVNVQIQLSPVFLQALQVCFFLIAIKGMHIIDYQHCLLLIKPVDEVLRFRL